MRFSVFAFSLLFAVLGHAAPAAQPDEMGKFMTERGLMARIGQVGGKVGNKASELVVNAMSFLGVPYTRGGSSFETGFDCSGFVKAIYEQTAGLVLPRRAEQQAASAQKIDPSELQPGDLVFFNTMRRAFSHVGIYVGGGKFIHRRFLPFALIGEDDIGALPMKGFCDGVCDTPPISHTENQCCLAG